jgi:hypothetical protein
VPEVQPEAQLVQLTGLEEPAWLYGASGPHAVHTASVVAFTVLLNRPTRHRVHTDDLVLE